MLDMMQIHDWAEEAISTAKDVTGAELDYSRASVGQLENVLYKLHETTGDDDAGAWDLACRMGAYFGETMLRNDLAEFGYEWVEDDDGEPILVTDYSNDGASLNRILPITRVYKCLLDGPSDSAAKLYAMSLSMLKGGDMGQNLEKLGIDPSQMSDIEPAYVVEGRFSANAAAWLLFNEFVFFQQHEITWDGENHGLTGMQINSAKTQDIPMLLANMSVLNGMADMLLQIEKDDALRVPLHMVHPGLHDALRNEDVTGITLFNLMSCESALMIKESSPDEYKVMCDSRLTLGIPSFYQLVSRMVWDMRAYNGRAGSFGITFANVRNFDGDAVFGEVVRMVPGAVSEAIYHVEVTGKPKVELPDECETKAYAERIARPFKGGFDEPTDIQADEELFETALNQLAREFPITMSIEGTHHLGRIPRIEHVSVGDSLILAADWQSEFFDPVCIEVFNACGETLGNLKQGFSLTLSGNREIACLLPHITATVESVTPKSKRGKSAKYALMDVRMELDPAVTNVNGGLSPEVIEAAKDLLFLPRAQRVVLSKGDIMASQLKGCIDVSEAVDVANPVGKTFEMLTAEPAEEDEDDRGEPITLGPRKEEGEAQSLARNNPEENSGGSESDVYVRNVIRHTKKDVVRPLDALGGVLPENLINCLKMCASNVVSSDFFIATFDWVKLELAEGCDAVITSTASQVAVSSLRAQAYKGAGLEEIELMQIAAMDTIIDLNAMAEFSSCDVLLDEIDEPSLEGLSEGRETEAAVTRVVDSVSAAYWNPVLKLVDVLIEVVGKKRNQEYEDAVGEWHAQDDEAKQALEKAEEVERRAQKECEEARRNNAKFEEELKAAKSSDEQKKKCEELLNEAKRAENDLTKAQFGLAEYQNSQREKRDRLSDLRKKLAGLGLFAFDKKRSLRQEIESLEKELSKVDDSIKSQERWIDTLQKKAGQRDVLENRLAGYTESRVNDIEDILRDAERKTNLAQKQLAEAKSERLRLEHSLKMVESERPKESDYSAEKAKRPLLWRPV